MRACVGDDKMWKPQPSFITPGTPLYNEEGGEILKGPRNLDAARRLLADSGYAGQPVTCLVGQDMWHNKAQGDVTADLLKRLGINVDFVAVDFGTVVARRVQKSPPGQGGWQMFHAAHVGAVCVDPSSYTAIRANGDKAWFGWPTSPKVEAAIEPGTTPRALTRRKRRCAGSIALRSRTWSMRRPASSGWSMPGARTSPESSRARCRYSGG